MNESKYDTNITKAETFNSKYVKINFLINHIQSNTSFLFNDYLEIINETIKSTIKKKVLISVMITNDKKMTDLNFKWRKIKKTTNVLSFSVKNKLVQDGYLLLGDIAI